MGADVLVDGVEAGADWLQERGFQFGDGLFETVAVRDGRPCLWRAHMLRLALGCRRLRLPQPDFARLADEGRQLCTEFERAVLKIYWTAGRSGRGYARPRPVRPQRALRRFAWPEPTKTWHVRSCAHRMGENPDLAEIKHLNRLDQVIARAEWDDPKISEGLMLGQDDRVLSGTMSNLFVQRGRRLFTPALDGAGIAGVVRKLVLDVGELVAQPVHVGRISLDNVRAADAIYLSNSLIGLVRVERCDDVDYAKDTGEHAAILEARRLCHLPEAWDAHRA